MRGLQPTKEIDSPTVASAVNINLGCDQPKDCLEQRD